MVKKVVFLLLSLVFVMSAALGSVSAAPKKEGTPQTVKGSFKEDGKSLKNSLVILQQKGKREHIFTATDAGGAFKANLADGTYAVKAVKGKNSDWFSVNKTFVVKEGKIKGNKDGDIQLSDTTQKKNPTAKTSNFTGVLKEGDQGLKGDLIIARAGEYDEEIYVVSSKSNGSFSAYLPDGNYYFLGIEESGGFYRYEKQFFVADGAVLVNGEPQAKLEIAIPAKAHSGKVGDSAYPLAGAAVILEKLVLGHEYESEFIEYVESNKKGEFSLRKLEDGIYSIGIYHDTYSSWNQLTFEVVDGDIYIDGEVSSYLQILVPDLNVKGTVTDGKKAIGNAYLLIEGEADGDFFGYWTSVDSKGKFQYRLADGHYTVYMVDEQNRTTMVYIPFEIRDGKMFQDGIEVSSLNIVLPPVTFTGKLTADGTAMQGVIAVEAVSENGDYEWYDAYTDEKGLLSLRLKDGSYRVVFGYLFEEEEEIALSLDFEIKGGKLYVDGKQQSVLEIEAPPVSVYGLVKDNGVPVENGYLSVVSEDYDIYIGKSIKSDGTFTMRLPDGEYRISQIHLNRSSGPMNLEFSVQDGKTYVAGELKEVLEVNVPPVTVKGTLSEAGTPLMGEIYIMQRYEADMPIEIWGYTDENGTFEFRLPDGEYSVYSVYLSDNSSFHPNVVFSVESGELYVNGEKQAQLNIEAPPVSVTGTLTEEGMPVHGGIAVTEINNDENPYYAWTWADNGVFQLRLPDGDYKVIEVYLEDGTSFNPGTEFSVVSGQLYIKDELADQLDVIVLPVTLTGAVYKGESPLTEGYVTITSVDGEFITNSWIYEGSFNGRLLDGDYKVSEIYDFENGPYYFDQRFTIADGKIYVDGEEVESLSLNLHDGWQEP
ncbi:carboxypeptidase-like regulatory domain-containing protein [Mesobacillus subterraneus]|uniref:Carboxypeptidase regulatory-like domain-containing protein n=1 Tax=Mesobacillus subterraneus TaxID=285983 RepID=A0A3R9F159_9BACI|nr:carboxypeptidase-like regulatory domain-containing protein [Mesobacillus subterraneus]RSD26835.1 carboxypeptidase regulatory-like domain-containing protein [Mesobacillus subterraneus]